MKTEARTAGHYLSWWAHNFCSLHYVTARTAVIGWWVHYWTRMHYEHFITIMHCEGHTVEVFLLPPPPSRAWWFLRPSLICKIYRRGDLVLHPCYGSYTAYFFYENCMKKKKTLFPTFANIIVHVYIVFWCKDLITTPFIMKTVIIVFCIIFTESK